MGKTLNLYYNSNDVDIRDNTIVLKPKRCYPFYPDEITEEMGSLRKYYKLDISFHRTMADEIFVVIECDNDHRVSPPIKSNNIKTKEDVRSIIAEALFRVKAFYVGEIPPSLKKSKIAEGYKYLTVSITDPDAVAKLFCDEYLECVLEWV